MQTDVRANLEAVKERVERAAVRAGRNPDGVKIVAVSKTHPSALINRAIDAGIHVFGENKVQEADKKITDIGRDKAEWHLIGHLQSNKARRAIELFDVIQSVDSLELAKRLERISLEVNRTKVSVFVQMDLAGEKTKSGVAEHELPPLVEYLKSCRCVSFDGLMLLPPFFDDAEKARPYFQRLRMLRDELSAAHAFAGVGELSMGMSHDFEVAIEEGATVVRVGTAIFGERVRPAPG